MSDLRILIWDDAYVDPMFFDASTPEKLAAASIEILRRLVHFDVLREPSQPHLPPNVVELADEVLPDDLPVALSEVLQRNIDDAKYRVAAKRRLYNAELARWTEIQRILTENDTSVDPSTGEPVAWEALAGVRHDLVKLATPVDPTVKPRPPI